jgi:hypothetical protein
MNDSLRMVLIALAIFPASGVESQPTPAAAGPNSPTRIYSVEELDAMFERPMSVRQLLDNVKIALDRDLLVQPSFYADGNLMKFFNGTAVVRKTLDAPEVPAGAPRQSAEIRVNDRVFPGMFVTAVYWRFQGGGYAMRDGFVPVHMRTSGYVEMEVAGVSNFTLGSVRSVLGRDTRHWMDTGERTDGGSGVPTVKGYVFYEDWPEKRPLIETNKTTFVIRLDAPPPTRRSEDLTRIPPPSFHDSDQVKAVWINQLER